MKKILLPLLGLSLLLCGCQKEGVDEAFLENNNLCLVEKGVTIHSYDPLTWQVSFNKDNNEFRVHTDNMSDYYILRCSALPQEEGQSIKCSIRWSGNSITSKSNLTFRVEKMDSAGRIWLWCKSSKIAVSVMILD